MRAKEFTVKQRDPNWKTLQAKRTSGAGGVHTDKKRQQKQGYEKHKKPVGVDEGQLELNTPDPVVVIQDQMGKILDKINLSVAAKKYQLGQPELIKKQLAHQNYTTIGKYIVMAPMSGQPQDKTTQGMAEATSYGQMPADAVRVLWNVYQKASQGVEQHRDEEGAKRIGNELNAAAKSLGVSQYMRSLYNGAANSAHMDFDTNPGDFVNWFTYVGDHLKGLYNIHKEKGSYDNDEPDLEPDVD